MHVSVCVHVNPSWAILGGWHSGKTRRMSPETNNPCKPTTPCKQLRFKKKKREREKKFLSHEYANMQRGVSACLKKCCFCFQQLIVQTTALSPSLCLSFCLPLSFCLSVFLTWSMNMVNRLDPALSSPSSLDGLRLAMEIENA